MPEKIRVLILGGGFAGVFAAKTLRRLGKDNLEIELINQTNYFVFQPLLPDVAAGGVSASDAVSPLRVLLKGVQIRLAEIIDINFDEKSVTVVQGTKRQPILLHYDHLVIALGQSVDLTRFPGLSEHALTMKNMADAFKLRNHIIGCLENADVATVPEVKQRLLTFVVVGAGFSGTETVGEIRSMIDRALRFYPNIKKEEVRVLLVESADRILLELPEDLAAYAAKRLEEYGVEILTGIGTKSATGTSVELTDGRTIQTATIIATIDNGLNPLVARLPLDFHWGKITVDRFMRVSSKKNVWALGDAALIPLIDGPQEERQHYAAPTAQFAVREGAQVAANIMASIKGQDLKPFAYKSKGALASLGTMKAVAQVYGIKISGTLAWLLWRGFYLSFLPGIPTKLRVLTNWILSAFIPRNLVQLQASAEGSANYIHYRKGDKVFEPGMRADGFYSIVEGAFDLKVKNPETGQIIERRLGPGDHFGERVILAKSEGTGLVQAAEDSIVLRVERSDFERFAKAFPVLDNYFSDYIEKTFGQKTSDKIGPDH